MCTKLCKTEKVLLGGHKVVLRNPKIGDLKSVLVFINSLVEEDVAILANKRYTLKEEKEWLIKTMNSIRKNKVHMVCAFSGAEYIGAVGLEKGFFRRSHVGTIGISIKKNYRGIGLGTLLLKKIIEIAKQDKEIKVLTLAYIEGNAIARNLYEKLGFKTIAKLPKRILYKGKHVAEYIMDYSL